MLVVPVLMIIIICTGGGILIGARLIINAIKEEHGLSEESINSIVRNINESKDKERAL